MGVADATLNAVPEPADPFSVPGRWQHALPDGRIQCDLCPRYCKLGDGQRAFCFVRERRGDRIFLTSWGRASGFCIDPIEKKPLNHFYPGSSVLSFGTAGCNLGCRFCQNWDISKARETARLSEVATPERIAEAAQRAGCRSVAFTYNDPVIFAEFALDVAQACRERGVATVAVTAGYIAPGARQDFFAGMDAANVDLKAFDDRFYRKLCFAEIEPVKETLRHLVRETDVWVEVTTLLIPGHNDSARELEALCAWFVDALGPDVPLHFTAFHPDYKLTNAPRTPHETLRGARELAKRHGIRHVYTGNVHDPAGQSTYCAHCGEVVVHRDGYQLGRYALDGDACRGCGARVPGRFLADGPGTWGPRRLRVAMA